TFFKKREIRMSALLKHSWSMLICLCVFLLSAQKTEGTELKNVVPQRECSDCIRADQSAMDKTMAHLYAERSATPVQALLQWSTYMGKSNKNKCPYGIASSNLAGIRTMISPSFLSPPHWSVPHAIDYYIYTLEHILI
ncbi:MAG: hypothetical protein IJZ40_06705, partial [Bacteroidaceae bacterium]|nr:hypothetical protein [Bacteroidaceae bacterium]